MTFELKDIWIRDPFIVAIPSSSKHVTGQSKTLSNNTGGGGEEEEEEDDDTSEAYYLLFGTTDKPPPGKNAYGKYPATGFACYNSNSLNGPWFGPTMVFKRTPRFWSKSQFWAPEICSYKGTWYLTACFLDPTVGRRVQILKSAYPQGPYHPFSDPVTPVDWFCLDGHLYFGEDEDRPILVFCREWLEVGDGEMYYLELNTELTGSARGATPIRLFSASEAKWPRPINSSHNNFVTDGPFLYKSVLTKELLMLWSSIGEKGNYCVGISRSKSGLIDGPWSHDDQVLFAEDGGHCMFFRPVSACPPLWEGTEAPTPLIMALHCPNKDPLQSRARFMVVDEIVHVDKHGKRLELRIDKSKCIT